MKIPIFLSCPKPYLQTQETFLKAVEAHLDDSGLCPMTLGRSEYSMDAPLVAIRKLMVASYGLLTIAFRRTLIVDGSDRPSSDLGEPEAKRNNTWLTSAYCQIEPAMAYQLGLPILIWREAGVMPDGLLDRGALDIAMPEFDLKSPPVFNQPQWGQPLQKWIHRVHSAYDRSAEVPKRW